jgi:type II secretory pathway pseudopilin PulG
MPFTASRGVTLVETLVATGVLITALAGVAQLFTLGSQLTRQAGASGAALLAAQDKLESLRGQAYTYGEDGAAATAAALEDSPASSLEENIDPFVDWLDRNGKSLSSPEDAVWLRRWRVTSLDAGTPEAIAIEVCVFRDVEGDVRQPDACLSTIRTRQP